MKLFSKNDAKFYQVNFASKGQLGIITSPKKPDFFSKSTPFNAAGSSNSSNKRPSSATTPSDAIAPHESEKKKSRKTKDAVTATINKNTIDIRNFLMPSTNKTPKAVLLIPPKSTPSSSSSTVAPLVAPTTFSSTVVAAAATTATTTTTTTTATTTTTTTASSSTATTGTIVTTPRVNRSIENVPEKKNNLVILESPVWESGSKPIPPLAAQTTESNNASAKSADTKSIDTKSADAKSTVSKSSKAKQKVKIMLNVEENKVEALIQNKVTDDSGNKSADAKSAAYVRKTPAARNTSKPAEGKNKKKKGTAKDLGKFASGQFECDEENWDRFISARKNEKMDAEVGNMVPNENETIRPRSGFSLFKRAVHVETPEEIASKFWVDKHAPTRPSEIFGNVKQFKIIQNWIESVKKGDPETKRAIMVSGPPGIGKTGCIKVILEHHGYTVVEVNASDARKKEDVDNLISPVLQSVRLEPTALLLDEMDGFSDSGRNFAVGRLCNVIEASSRKVPIVMCCNDRFSNAVIELSRYCIDIRMNRLSKKDLTSIAARVYMREKIPLNVPLMNKVIGASEGDARIVIGNLEMINRSSSAKRVLAEMNARNKDWWSSHEDLKEISFCTYCWKLASEEAKMEAKRMLGESGGNENIKELVGLLDSGFVMQARGMFEKVSIDEITEDDFFCSDKRLTNFDSLNQMVAKASKNNQEGKWVTGVGEEGKRTSLPTLHSNYCYLVNHFVPDTNIVPERQQIDCQRMSEVTMRMSDADLFSNMAWNNRDIGEYMDYCVDEAVQAILPVEQSFIYPANPMLNLSSYVKKDQDMFFAENSVSKLLSTAGCRYVTKTKNSNNDIITHGGDIPRGTELLEMMSSIKTMLKAAPFRSAALDFLSEAQEKSLRELFFKEVTCKKAKKHQNADGTISATLFDVANVKKFVDIMYPTPEGLTVEIK